MIHFFSKVWTNVWFLPLFTSSQNKKFSILYLKMWLVKKKYYCDFMSLNIFDMVHCIIITILIEAQIKLQIIFLRKCSCKQYSLTSWLLLIKLICVLYTQNLVLLDIKILHLNFLFCLSLMFSSFFICTDMCHKVWLSKRLMIFNLFSLKKPAFCLDAQRLFPVIY